MLTVYHLAVSQSERAIWICEELGIDYELVRIGRDPLTRLAPAEYKAVSPTGTAPVIVHKDGGREIVIAESGAVVEYIDAKFGDSRLALKPSDPYYAQYLFWFHFSNSSLMALTLTKGTLSQLDVQDTPFNYFWNDREERYYDLLDKQLGATEFLGGDKFTLADIMILFPLTTARYFVPVDLKPYPNIQKYIKRIGARPAYLRAMKKGDPNLKLKL